VLQRKGEVNWKEFVSTPMGSRYPYALHGIISQGESQYRSLMSTMQLNPFDAFPYMGRFEETTIKSRKFEKWDMRGPSGFIISANPSKQTTVEFLASVANEAAKKTTFTDVVVTRRGEKRPSGVKTKTKTQQPNAEFQLLSTKKWPLPKSYEPYMDQIKPHGVDSVVALVVTKKIGPNKEILVDYNCKFLLEHTTRHYTTLHYTTLYCPPLHSTLLHSAPPHSTPHASTHSHVTSMHTHIHT